MFQRPIFLAGLICLIGTAAAFSFSPFRVAFILTIGMLFFGIFIPQKKQTILFAGICGLLACVSVLFFQMKAERLSSYAGETVWLEGTITDIRIGTNWVQSEAIVLINGQKETIDLVSYSMEPLEQGQRFRAVVELEKANDRYSGIGDILQGTILHLEDQETDNSFLGIAVRMRAWLIRRMENLFHGTSREIFMGLLLGEKANLSYEVKEVFNKSGTAHLLTVSGFHISIMAGGIYWLLGKLNQSPKFTAAVTIPLIFLLALVEAMTVSVMRAAMMSVIFYLSVILEREYDGLNAWGLSLLLTLLFDPSLVFSGSLLLSYSAVLGILLFQKKIYGFLMSLFRAPMEDSRPLNLLCRILELMSVTIAANSLALPFLIYFFGYIPVISLVSSVLTFPLLPYIIGVTAAAMFCPLAPLAKLLAAMAQIMADILYRILAVLAEWDWILYGQDDGILVGLILFCIGSLLLWSMGVKRRTALGCIAGFLVVFCGAFGIDRQLHPPQTELVSCRNTAVLTNEGRAVIVGSPERQSDLEEIEKVLNCAHVHAVDLLLISRMPKDDGITALELQKRLEPAVMASAVELDAFDLTGTSYKKGKHDITFWKHWTLETAENGAILSDGRDTVAKLRKATENCDADALLYDDYAFALTENVTYSFTWDRQLKLHFAAE